jgi:nicotinamide-nucleotide amidase
VILTGGLGPTSDDLTRFALSHVINQPLVFYSPSWKRIVERLEKRNLPIPENNRQQALFPQSAKVLINQMGTADGCMVEFQGKLIFMLPGPPRECIPLFQKEVLPHLLNEAFGSQKRLHRWRLMGVSESAIAEKLEVLAKSLDLEFAYRAAYPYIDVKLMLEQNAAYPNIIEEVGKIVAPYFVTNEDKPISLILKEALLGFKDIITLCDFATKGALMSALSNPHTQERLQTDTTLCRDYCVLIEGLQDYWQPKEDSVMTNLTVTLHHDGETFSFQTDIFLRGTETLDFAVEFTCHKIYKHWFKV